MFAMIGYEILIVVLAVFGGGCSVLVLNEANRRATNSSRRPLLDWRYSAIVIVTALAAGYLTWWYVKPNYYIAAIEDSRRAGDPDTTWAQNALAAVGPRAFNPIFEHIEGLRVFDRGTCILPLVLSRMGPKAHSALIERTDHEQDPKKRIGYINVLIEEFHDNTRLNLWIDYALSRRRDDCYLRSVLYKVYPDAPWVQTDSGAIDIAFVRWYAKRNPISPFISKYLDGNQNPFRSRTK
jgi:hypothetical protein